MALASRIVAGETTAGVCLASISIGVVMLTPPHDGLIRKANRPSRNYDDAPRVLVYEELVRAIGDP